MKHPVLLELERVLLYAWMEDLEGRDKVKFASVCLSNIRECSSQTVY